MGLGSTTKKIQLLAERAEQLYAQVGELRDQLTELRSKLDDTHDTVTALERQQREQDILLRAMAEDAGIDVEAVLTEAAIDDVEPTDTEDDAETTEE